MSYMAAGSTDEMLPPSIVAAIISFGLAIGGGAANTVANVDPIRAKLRTKVIYTIGFNFFSPFSNLRNDQLTRWDI